MIFIHQVTLQQGGYKIATHRDKVFKASPTYSERASLSPSTQQIIEPDIDY